MFVSLKVSLQLSVLLPSLATCSESNLTHLMSFFIEVQEAFSEL